MTDETALPERPLWQFLIKPAICLFVALVVLIVDLTLAGRYHATQPVLMIVASRPLKAGHLIKSKDLALKFDRVVGDIPDYPTKEQLVGESVAHDLPAGHMILFSDLQITKDSQPHEIGYVDDKSVYFELNKSQRPGSTEETLRGIIDAAVKNHACQIYLRGFADRSGTPVENLWLSRLRTDTVADLLIATGIRRGQIVKIPRGDEDPRITTKAGVREERNRRVEVHIECPQDAENKKTPESFDKGGTKATEKDEGAGS